MIKLKHIILLVFIIISNLTSVYVLSPYVAETETEVIHETVFIEIVPLIPPAPSFSIIELNGTLNNTNPAYIFSLYFVKVVYPIVFSNDSHEFKINWNVTGMYNAKTFVHIAILLTNDRNYTTLEGEGQYYTNIGEVNLDVNTLNIFSVSINIILSTVGYVRFGLISQIGNSPFLVEIFF